LLKIKQKNKGILEIEKKYQSDSPDKRHITPKPSFVRHALNNIITGGLTPMITNLSPSHHQSHSGGILGQIKKVQ
jgi:hypothetical protein